MSTSFIVSRVNRLNAGEGKKLVTTTQIGALVLAFVFLVLYLARRRSRLRREQGEK